MRSAGFRCRGLQGTEADAARLGLAASPADPAVRWPHGGVGLAAAGLPAPGDGTRHARHRPAGNQMQAAMTSALRLAGLLLLATAGSGVRLHGLRDERARQHHERRRSRSDEDGEDRAGRPAPARHHHDRGRQRDPGLRERRRHDPDHRLRRRCASSAICRPAPIPKRSRCTSRAIRSMCRTRTTTW